MKIGVIGAGRIGGNAGRLLARAGHEVLFSFTREPEKLHRLVEDTGHGARAGTPREAAEFGEAVMLAVPWDLIDEALAQAGSLEGKIVIDTTNQFGSGPMPAPGQTAAQFNAARMPGARYTKSFNTLTSGFQASAAGRSGDERAVLFLCGDDPAAKRAVSGLIEDAGFVPVDIGPNADASVMEAPRREGAVYGEEYRRADPTAVVEAVREGRPIPATPTYGRGAD